VAWLKREIMQRFALLPWGDENWVPSAGWAGAGRGGLGFCGGPGGGGRGGRCTVVAACRLSSLFTPGPFEAVKEFSCRDPLAGNHRCCCVRVCQSPVLAGVLAGGVPCPLSGGGMPLQEVAA
jgi:hypothetical protein